MGQESDQLRREIEQTRRELGTDVDALTEKVSPRRVVGRRVDRTKGALVGLKEKVMGTTSDAAGSVQGGMHSAAGSMQGAASSVQDVASSATSAVADTASSTAYAARRRTQGNPLAAGVVAFGLGWLVSSLLPPSETEREVAAKVREQAQPVAEQAGQALTEVKDNLREPARHAAESVKETASDAAGTVQEEAKAAASDVKGEAQDAGQEVRQQASTPR